MPPKLAPAALALAALWSCSVVPLRAQSLEYQTLDFGTTGTFLTGIRGDNIIGNYVIPGGETGRAPLQLRDGASGRRSRSPRRTSANYPGAIGSSPYGPSFGSAGGVLRVVGSYKTAASPGRSRLSLRRRGGARLRSPDAGLSRSRATEFTIAHSTFGNTVVGNYDTGPLTGNAFIYDIPSGTYTTNNRPGALSTTAYGVWGDKIAGGYGLRPRPRARLRAWLHLRRPAPIAGRPTTIPTPSSPISRASPARAAAANTTSSPTGSAPTGRCRPPCCTSTPRATRPGSRIAFPGADVTSANSIHQDRVIGIYTDASGIHGFEVTIPGIYNPILNSGGAGRRMRTTRPSRGRPGRRRGQRAGRSPPPATSANAIRGDRYGVIYNYGTVTVSGATGGAVALRGEFPTLLNNGMLIAAARPAMRSGPTRTPAAASSSTPA